MNVSIFSHPAIWALGWTLLHVIWQGFAIVLPLAVAFHLLRQQSSRLRYGIGVGALLLQVMVSIGTFLYYYLPTLASRSSTTPPVITGQRIFSFAYDPMPMAVSIPWQTQLQRFLEAHLTEVVSCWLIGVVVFLIRLIGGWVYLQQLKQTAIRITDNQLLQTVDNLKDLLNIRSTVRIVETARITVPMVIGVLKPVVLLPIGLATGLSLREIEAVLAHELAHVQRADYAVNLLQSVIEVLFFFHPALWWLSARVREERELCCDDVAVQICGDGRILAQALAQVEEFAQTPVLAMALASERKQLLHRVRRMLGVPVKPVVSNARLAGLTLATLLLLSVSVYAVQQKANKQDDKPKKSVQKRTNRLTTFPKYELTIDNDGTPKDIIWQDKPLSKERTKRIQELCKLVRQKRLLLDEIWDSSDREIVYAILAPEKSTLPQLPASVHLVDSIQTSNGWVQSTETWFDTDTLPINEPMTLSVYDLPSTRVKQERLSELHNQQIDSLNRINQALQVKIEAIQLQLERQSFKVEELERKTELLEWKKNKARDTRSALIQKNQELMHHEGKEKVTEAELEKRMADSEAKIKESEQLIEALNKELEKLQTEENIVRQPYQALEREIEQLQRQQEKIMEQNENHMEAMARSMDFENHRFRYTATIAPTRARASRRANRSYQTPRAALAPGAAVGVTVPAVAAPARPAYTPKPPTLTTTPKPATAPKPRD